MSRYKSTTKQRYMWGIGVVCSLLLVVITSSWALEGRVGYRLRSFGSETVGEVRREEAPVRFWIITGFFLVASVAGTVVTGIGLSKVQRREDEKTPNQSPEPTAPSGRGSS